MINSRDQIYNVNDVVVVNAADVVVVVILFVDHSYNSGSCCARNGRWLWLL